MLLAITSCQYPHKPVPTESSDVPQASARRQLRSILGDLTAVPAIPIGYTLAQLVHAPLYSSSVDMIAVIQADTCVTDSCIKFLRLYRWDVARRAYELRDSLQTRSNVRISAEDVTGDGLDELILRSTDGKRSGISVLGVTNASHVLITRYQRDSIVPRVFFLPTHASLVEYDSIYSKLIAGIAVTVPKKYFSLQGEFFLESPADSNWAHYVDRVRDSIHLVLSLTRDEMRSERHPDEGLQRAFVKANIGAALLDTSWYHAQREISLMLREFTAKLSSNYYQSLARVSLIPRAAHFVRQSTTWNPQLLEVLNDLDDAIALRDEARCRSLASYVLQTNPDPNALVRSANALIGNDLLLDVADRLLIVALERTPTNVSALRARATVLEREEQPDSARALLIRSLQFDSTSSEAMRIRQELAY